MRTALRVGIVIFNLGEYHAAHDAWEDIWLQLERGSTDERFLHGLIQYTAAVHHAANRNWTGATGLATSAIEYLDDLGATYAGVNLEPIRLVLLQLGRDPEWIERRTIVPIEFNGDTIDHHDLSLEEIAHAARIIAEEYDYDPSVVRRAKRFAQADIEDGRSTTPFIPLLYDFVDPGRNRIVVFHRLRQHVDRRTDREADVEGLFDC